MCQTAEGNHGFVFSITPTFGWQAGVDVNAGAIATVPSVLFWDKAMNSTIHDLAGADFMAGGELHGMSGIDIDQSLGAWGQVPVTEVRGGAGISGGGYLEDSTRMFFLNKNKMDDFTKNMLDGQILLFNTIVSVLFSSLALYCRAFTIVESIIMGKATFVL